MTEAWKQYDELTDVLDYISFSPSQENVNTALPTLEKLVVLLHDRTSTYTSINECKKNLFSRKGRLTEELPLTLDAFKLHVNRAVYQASYCCAQSLLKDHVLPDPNEWEFQPSLDYDSRRIKDVSGTDTTWV